MATPKRKIIAPCHLAPQAPLQFHSAHTHYAPFYNLKYVHVTIDICSSLVYALVLSGKEAINAIEALKSVMVVMGVHWVLKTDNGLAHAFQQQ